MTENNRKDEEYEDRVLIVVVVVVVAAIGVALHFWRDWLLFRAPMWLQMPMYAAGLVVLLGKAVKWIEQDSKASALKSQEEQNKDIKP